MRILSTSPDLSAIYEPGEPVEVQFSNGYPQWIPGVFLRYDDSVDDAYPFRVQLSGITIREVGFTQREIRKPANGAGNGHP